MIMNQVSINSYIVRGFIEDINKDKEKRLIKNQQNIDNYLEIRRNEENRKEVERKKIQKEKENDAKWYEESLLLLDKQDKIRMNKIILNEDSPTKQNLGLDNKKSNEIKEFQIERPIKGIVNNKIEQKDIIKMENAILHKIFSENM